MEAFFRAAIPAAVLAGLVYGALRIAQALYSQHTGKKERREPESTHNGEQECGAPSSAVGIVSG